jgi:hypothetical protein
MGDIAWLVAGWPTSQIGRPGPTHCLLDRAIVSEFVNRRRRRLLAEFFRQVAMRALILAFVGGIALGSSTQAAPFALKPAAIELASAPLVERAAQDCGCGLALDTLVQPMG